MSKNYFKIFACASFVLASFATANAEDLCLKAVFPNACTNVWDEQITYDLAAPLTIGTEYTLSVKIKATSDFTVGTWGLDAINNATQYGLGAQLQATTEWTTANATFTASQAITKVQFVMGGDGTAGTGFAGTMYFDDVVLCATDGENLIANGDFAAMSAAGWAAINGSCGVSTLDGEIPSVGENGNGILKITADASATSNPWDCQLYYDMPVAMEAGEVYTLSITGKATEPFEIIVWPCVNGGDTQYGIPNLQFGTEEATLTSTFTAALPLNRLVFCLGAVSDNGKTGFAGEMTFDNVSVIKEGTTENLVENGDFSKVTTEGWTKPGWHTNISFTHAIIETTGVQSVAVENELPVVYYNLQGVRVANPAAGQLYITNKGKKVLFR